MLSLKMLFIKIPPFWSGFSFLSSCDLTETVLTSATLCIDFLVLFHFSSAYMCVRIFAQNSLPHWKLTSYRPPFPVVTAPERKFTNIFANQRQTKIFYSNFIWLLCDFRCCSARIRRKVCRKTKKDTGQQLHGKRRMRNQHWRVLKILFRGRQLRVIVQFKHADSGCKRVEKFHVAGPDSRKRKAWKSSESAG